ncbi:hypothetical protein WMY93_024183 [Mugilogobius chulae]|uniref:Uncharacterized protein n=1 Tax=Mugilogobius chulae TaxID=88201 RepID=A0AAW0MZY0_9GOBI
MSWAAFGPRPQFAQRELHVEVPGAEELEQEAVESARTSVSSAAVEVVVVVVDVSWASSGAFSAARRREFTYGSSSSHSSPSSFSSGPRLMVHAGTDASLHATNSVPPRGENVRTE